MGQLTGMAIRAFRVARGMTQKELADKLGATDQAVYLWESDRRRPQGIYARELGKLMAEAPAEAPAAEVMEATKTAFDCCTALMRWSLEQDSASRKANQERLTFAATFLSAEVLETLRKLAVGDIAIAPAESTPAGG